MDFVLALPEKPDVGALPWFGGTVAESARRAVAALGAKIELLDGKGVLLPEGLVEIPADRVRVLAPGGALRNDAGQTLALAPAAIHQLPLDSFDAAVEAMEWRYESISGFTRITDAATWSKALGEARRRVARRFLEAGVLVEDPQTLWADPGVEAAAGARIGPSVRLTGETRIGAGAEIAEFSRLHNTIMAEGARIESHSVVLDADIGREARVGPFARIRPGTTLEQGAYVGGFVETKNARIGRNAAVPHLSYVGDADIGTRVNLGAGTITCNYDGRAKHRTVVAPGAFVGSNAILVAPVTIGRRAFVAAGSVIIEDVPEGAMAIARGRQVNKPDRAGDRFEGADEV